MKKGWKIFWIIIVLAVGLGIAFCGISLVMGVTLSQIREAFPYGTGVVEEILWENEEIDGSTEILTEGDVYEFQGITSLEMSVGMCDVEILPSEDDKVRVDTTEYWHESNVGIAVDEKDGKLTIKTVKEGKILNVLSFIADGEEGGELRVYLPTDIRLDKAEMTFGAAEAEIKALTAKEAVLKTGAADCVINHMDVGSLQADVGAGSMELEGKLQGDLTVKCGAGDVEAELDGKEADYNYSIKSGAGDIMIGGKNYDGLASVKEIDNGSDWNIDIICGAGDVEIDFSQSSYGESHRDESYHHDEEHHD